MKRSSAFTCPHCGSRNVRRSQRQSPAEFASMLVGKYPVRCLDCGKRSTLSVLLLSKLAFAKCPRCLEMRLSTWDLNHYRISAWKKLQLRLGAHRYRCNGCRYNFVSFRRLAASAPKR